MRIPYQEMISEFTRVLVKYGFSCESAKSAAKIFADNSLCGVYSHGLNRFPIFIEVLKKGKIDPDKVTIEVLKDTISNTYAEILITDNNETPCGWGDPFRIQELKDGKWIESETIGEMIFKSIGYLLNEDNQLKQKVNWEYIYGELDAGTYRIVKSVYSGEEYIDLYSNEFEIK